MDISRRDMFAFPVALPLIAAAGPALAEGHDTVIIDRPGEFRWHMSNVLSRKHGKDEAKELSLVWFGNAVVTTEFATAIIIFPFKFQKQWCASHFGAEMEWVCREQYGCPTMTLKHGAVDRYVYTYEHRGTVEMIDHEGGFGYARVAGRRVVFFDVDHPIHDMKVGDRVKIMWSEIANSPTRALSVYPV